MKPRNARNDTAMKGERPVRAYQHAAQASEFQPHSPALRAGIAVHLFRPLTTTLLLCHSVVHPIRCGRPALWHADYERRPALPGAPCGGIDHTLTHTNPKREF
jgi:hypothetical protein